MTIMRTIAGINKTTDAGATHVKSGPPMRCSELSDSKRVRVKVWQ